MSQIDQAKSKYLQIRRLFCEYEKVSIDKFIAGYKLRESNNPYIIEYINAYNELANLLSDNELKIYIENSAKRNKLN